MSDKRTFEATSDCCFRRHLLVVHATRWLVFRCRTDARENFSLLSVEDFEHQSIAITNRQRGRSACRQRLLHKVGIPVVAPAAAASRRPPSPMQPMKGARQHVACRVILSWSLQPPRRGSEQRHHRPLLFRHLHHPTLRGVNRSRPSSSCWWSHHHFSVARERCLPAAACAESILSGRLRLRDSWVHIISVTGG